jgi:hypothetical protein
MSPDALTVALAAEVRNRFDTPCYVYDHSIRDEGQPEPRCARALP